VFSMVKKNMEWLSEDIDFMSYEKDYNDFAHLLAKYTFSGGNIKEGDIIKGKVIEINDSNVMVDIDHKMPGIVSKKEFKKADGSYDVELDKEVEVYVESLGNKNNQIILSREKAIASVVWDKLQTLYTEGSVISGKVIGSSKGGLFIDLENIKCFMPASQIDSRLVKNFDKFVGETLECKILNLDKKKSNVIVSRKAVLEGALADQKEKVISALNVGDKIKGIVKSLPTYGAFIDIGGVDGLMHITDISWNRLQHPSEVLTVGQEIEVQVLNVDLVTKKFSLSLKHLQPSPWDSLKQNYTAGNRVSGTVSSITDYGVFVELEPGISGLVHISELTWNRRIKDPKKVVKMGEIIEVMVQEVDIPNHRISLSLKQLLPNHLEAAFQKYKIGEVITGQVRHMTDFGLFVSIEEEVDGFIHISDISYTKRIKHPSEAFTKGQSVSAKILDIDVLNSKFTLGIKQLGEDPFVTAQTAFKIGEKYKSAVSRILEIGIFVELSPGVEGLILKKELSKQITAYSVGEIVEFAVVNFNVENRKVDLSEEIAKNT
jgi:small subunit ribosomal protein S1